MATIDGSTAGLSRASGLFMDDVRSSATVPALTILYHPDVRRVGKRAVLSEAVLGHEALVSRHQPEFSPPDQASGEALADRHLSRQPIRLHPTPEGGVILTTSGSRTRVEVAGAPVLQALELPAAALRISRTSLYALIDANPRIRKAGDLKTDEIVLCHRECGGNLDAMIDRLEVSKKALGRRLREMGLL
jgi:hypothetical protein